MSNLLGRWNAALMASVAAAALLPGTATAGLLSPVTTLLPTSKTAAPQVISGDLSPLYGKINAFYGGVEASYGKINAFYGKINPFYGKINPFFGDVSPYYGKINPFTQATDSATLAVYGTSYDPFWGSASPYRTNADYASLSGFWRTEFAAWNPILASWLSASSLTDATNVAASIQAKLVAPATSFWSPIMARMPTRGVTTSSLIASNLAEAGVTFNADGSINAASLLGSNSSQRAMLFLNLYDDLMDYAGTGHVDWWMGATGWTPALADAQTNTSTLNRPLVGMIDFAITVAKGIDGKPLPGVHLSKQVLQLGSQQFGDGHGAAVGSLIMGATDGSGILGVMPKGTVDVAVYDPYDDSGTTNWTDVGIGLALLNASIVKGKIVPMGVLNASLGEPGWTLAPGWNDALALALAHDRVLVVAAGNDGATQTQNVRWNFYNNPTLIIVGSVGADGVISNFSNRPGEACLLPAGGYYCSEGNKLKYRFITAPGELILVSDGVGGHDRHSGTSLAAPLVSGAIALLQSRWPWLSYYPDETASIILDSATPKGEHPGADPVYGVGELNIAASQAPLDWSALTYYQTYNGKMTSTPLSLRTVIPQIRQGTQSAWDAAGLSYTAIERIGSTFRDFQIPLSSRLVGQNVTTAAGPQAYQTYLSTSLRAQAGYFQGLAMPAPADLFRNGFERSALPAGEIGGMTLRLSLASTATRPGFRNGDSPFEGGAALVGGRGAILFGFGNGAAALDGNGGFLFHTDYDLAKGGVNPVLGLASGGSYLGGRVAPLRGLSVSFGITRRSAARDLQAFGLVRGATGAWARRYDATAETMSVAYALSPRLIARAALTHLDEPTALLGIQSLDRADLQGGSTTDATSVGFDLALGSGFALSGSGTIARTSAGRGQIVADGLVSRSAAIAVTKRGLLGRHDQLRITAATPLRTIGGRLAYQSVGVVDRETGELGVISQSLLARSGRLPLAGEAMYGMAMPGLGGEFSLFGRVDRSAALAGDGDVDASGGVQLRLAF